MDTMAPIRRGLSRTWEGVREGWEQLREQAAGAITRFVPSRTTGDVETSEERLAYRTPGWGVLTADVQETDDQVHVRLEVPGMSSQDFELEVVDQTLRVSGEKRVENEESRGRFYVIESAYGHFERLVPLPAEVNQQGAKARYRNGVLRVTLPKSEGSKRRRIEVEAT
ncbi:Hsp20/alpha crystallin family protein [Thiohalorhabdus sp.]|uniref:Hsp20/alpha crystallin family protein n=1 Tax=Thiohalorhabdus sp. TaxID=3094134 RepID=UPI002FC2CEB9